MRRLKPVMIRILVRPDIYEDVVKRDVQMKVNGETTVLVASKLYDHVLLEQKRFNIIDWHVDMWNRRVR